MKSALCLVLACAGLSSARPRYLLVPIEDVEFVGDYAQQFPVVTMPALARQARDLSEIEETIVKQPVASQYIQAQKNKYRSNIEQVASASNAYSEPAPAASNYGAAPASNDHVDYGAYTGPKGSFGWYSDHPVRLFGIH